MEIAEDWNEQQVFEIAGIADEMLEILYDAAQEEDPEIDQGAGNAFGLLVQIRSGVPEQPG